MAPGVEPSRRTASARDSKLFDIRRRLRLIPSEVELVLRVTR
jgi:hypothetical protein